jgi:hypothetical protein
MPGTLIRRLIDRHRRTIQFLDCPDKTNRYLTTIGYKYFLFHCFSQMSLKENKEGLAYLHGIELQEITSITIFYQTHSLHLLSLLFFMARFIDKFPATTLYLLPSVAIFTAQPSQEKPGAPASIFMQLVIDFPEGTTFMIAIALPAGFWQRKICPPEKRNQRSRPTSARTGSSSPSAAGW